MTKLVCKRGHKRIEGEYCQICLAINRSEKNPTERMRFDFGLTTYEPNVKANVAAEFLNACMFEWRNDASH